MLPSAEMDFLTLDLRDSVEDFKPSVSSCVRCWDFCVITRLSRSVLRSKGRLGIGSVVGAIVVRNLFPLLV